MIIYGVFHCDYDGGGIISHHETKKGAYNEMRYCKINDYNEWFDSRILYGKGTKWHKKHRPEHYKISTIELKP